MKKENGVTLISLLVYVTVMIVVIGALNIIINEFYSNTNEIQEDTEDLLEFNKFNTYFLKEIKSKGNSVDSIGTNGEYILFSSGNSFSVNNNNIYFNNIKICEDVNQLLIKKGKDGDGINNDIIFVTLKIGNFTKSINYKVEEIY